MRSFTVGCEAKTIETAMTNRNQMVAWFSKGEPDSGEKGLYTYKAASHTKDNITVAYAVARPPVASAITSSSVTSLLIVAWPTKKMTAPIINESTPILPIHTSHCEVLSKLGIQGDIKITATPNALEMRPNPEQR